MFYYFRPFEETVHGQIRMHCSLFAEVSRFNDIAGIIRV